MKTAVIILFAFLLAACATPPAPKLTNLQFNDEGFTNSSIVVDEKSVLALSKEMQTYLRTEIMPQIQRKGPQKALFDALASKNQIKLEYDAEMTRTAAQAFHVRSGNCLSLLLMTSALAKEMGLEVQYQNVILNESWSRNEDLYFSAGHVNIVLARRSDLVHNAVDYSQPIVIDFLPPNELQGQKTEPLSEATVIAMYMNNRAAELLSKHNINDAYWFAREALRIDPNFLIAYNTLGVIYQHHGDLNLAEKVFKQILQLSPENTLALSNLVGILRLEERMQEAQMYLSELERLQPHPPFYYFNLGLVAMGRGDYKEAKSMFKKEIVRDPNYDEFHLWLALAYLQLGEISSATDELQLAKENSTTHKAHDLYVSKLERIKASYTH